MKRLQKGIAEDVGMPHKTSTIAPDTLQPSRSKDEPYKPVFPTIDAINDLRLSVEANSDLLAILAQVPEELNGPRCHIQKLGAIASHPHIHNEEFQDPQTDNTFIWLGSTAMHRESSSASMIRPIEGPHCDIDVNEALSISSRESDGALPPLLAEYLDHKGKIGIYRERLQEHDFYHRVAITERKRIRNQGDFVDIPDLQFEQTYKARRHLIKTDLKAAEADAESTAILCREAGLTIDNETADTSIDAISTGSSSKVESPKYIDQTLALDTIRVPGLTQVDTWLRSISDDYRSNMY